MKIKDIMEKQVDYVTSDTSVKDVCHLIFERGINGVPVCKNNKVIGFITERDVLEKFFPSMQEYIEDPVHEGNFEGMEEKVSYIFSLTADKIMSRRPITVNQDTPVLKAQSTMFVHKIGRLPVVDDNGNLVGIVSKGDIFRTVVGQRFAFGEEEGFFDWQANYYDHIMDWGARLPSEIPGMIKAFKKEKVEKVLDIASSTGEHTIALAKSGFSTVGFDASGRMIKISEKKKTNLSQTVQERIEFLKGYKESFNKLPKDFDAAIFMGDALSHVIITDKNILKEVVNVFKPEKGLLVFQISNFKKVLETNRGMREFVMRKFGFGYERNHAFFSFYTRGKGKSVTNTRVIFEHNGKKWVFRGMSETEIMYIDRKEIDSILRKLGFKEIDFYGSKFYQPLFKNSFNSLEDDWLGVIAKR